MNERRKKLIEEFKCLDDWTLVDTEMAAAVIGISQSYLKRARLDARINDGPPYVNLGDRVSYRKSDLIEWMNNLKAKEKKSNAQTT